MGLPKMKFIKRISLFLLTAGMMFSAGSYVTLKAEQFFYPNKYERAKENTLFGDTADTSDKKQPSLSTESTVSKEPSDETAEVYDNKRVIEAAAEEIPMITADTIYLVGKVDLSDGTIEEKEEEVPVKYIGLDRVSLLEELDSYNKNPPLSELKLGFENIELTAFSKERVVICKYYNAKDEEESFYLMVADHFVVVYKEDKQTIYMNTDILLENLSSQLQEEIIAGKFIENEQELYNFLESYSS